MPVSLREIAENFGVGNDGKNPNWMEKPGLNDKKKQMTSMMRQQTRGMSPHYSKQKKLTSIPRLELAR